MIFNDWLGLEKAHSKISSTNQHTGKTSKYSSWSSAQGESLLNLFSTSRFFLLLFRPGRNPTFSAHPYSIASISSRCLHFFSFFSPYSIDDFDFLSIHWNKKTKDFISVFKGKRKKKKESTSIYSIINRRKG